MRNKRDLFTAAELEIELQRQLRKPIRYGILWTGKALLAREPRMAWNIAVNTAKIGRIKVACDVDAALHLLGIE